MIMQTKTPLALALLLCGLATAGTALAQGAVSGEVRDLKGAVMVLKGKDYINAAQGMALASGDRVLVLEKATAKVVINTSGERCEIDLKENQALTISATGCKALIASVQTVPGAGAPGSAAVAAGGGATASNTAAAMSSSGALWVGGAAAVSGGLFLGTRNKASGD
ncbi:MAG: hypothetical protein U1F10_02370 [Burkholderiales bacterium]